MTPRNTPRPNTPTEQNKEDSQLLLYRLKLVEKAVKDVGDELRKQDNIKRQDLIDFRDIIVERVNEIKIDLQKQIDSKASQSDLQDVKTLIKAVGSILGSVIAALTVYFITQK